MAQIDQLLQAMDRFGAQAAFLKSGEKVQLSFPTGKRYTSQTTPHEGLVAMVEEILPRGVELEDNATTEFVHQAGDSAISVRVQVGPPGAGDWRVWIEPSSAPPPAEPGPGAASISSAVPAAAPVSAPRARNAAERLLLRMLAVDASDLHLSTGSPPFVRIHGVMKHLPGAEAIGGEELLELLYEITPARNREEFERRNDTDFAYSIPGASRFRVNLFRDRHGAG